MIAQWRGWALAATPALTHGAQEVTVRSGDDEYRAQAAEFRAQAAEYRARGA
jgi:hypothetical protein